MTSATDTDVLERLDFEHELPCEIPVDTAMRPCREPARYLIRFAAHELKTHLLACEGHAEPFQRAAGQHPCQCGTSMVSILVEAL